MDSQNSKISDNSQYFFSEEGFLRDSSLIELIQLANYQKDLVYWEQQDNPLQAFYDQNCRGSSTNTQIPIQQENVIQKSIKKCSVKAKLKILKTKTISKQKSTTKRKISTNDPPISTCQQKGNPSKYNNMGTFLIGTFSDILNQGEFQLSRTDYLVEINKIWKTIVTGLSLQNLNKFVDILKNLKKQVSLLPRKQGAKKDLYKIINTNYDKDSFQVKICKSFLRKEIIAKLKNEQWLANHVQSRDFKPVNDDQQGTKKKERHEAYRTYLMAIKNGLECRDQIPKRLNL